MRHFVKNKLRFTTQWQRGKWKLPWHAKMFGRYGKVTYRTRDNHFINGRLDAEWRNSWRWRNQRS